MQIVAGLSTYLQDMQGIIDDHTRWRILGEKDSVDVCLYILQRAGGLCGSAMR